MKNVYTRLLIALMTLVPAMMTAQVEQGRIPDKRTAAMSPVQSYATSDFAIRQVSRATDPAIEAMVAAVNADTIRKTLIELGNWGSRFLMNDNRREIASSLMEKFQSYGYTDVRLDSFYLIISWQGMTDSAWQYNVVCTMQGSSAPDEVYVIGGHWDSICLPDPVNDAPGVNDNGSAVAATLEIARVMKQFNYQPQATIRFTLFAAEELGLFGSTVDAHKAWETGEDIRYMLNLDMISNNPDNQPKVKIFHYLTKEWAGALASDITQRYTDLEVFVPQDNMPSSSDSYPYWYFDFPVAYFEEYNFSPNWHKPSDTLGNCNVPYLTKITGASLAILAEQQKLPYPQKLQAKSTRNEILLTWKPTANQRVKGYNIYRSTETNGNYQKINTSLVTDSSYADQSTNPHEQMYYMITLVNDALEEGVYSGKVSGARFSFCDSLLVLANVKGTKPTPDSIYNFYADALDTIPFVWKDINATDKVTLGDFSRYRSILWMSNSVDFESLTTEIYEGFLAFIENGGNILFTGFNPARFWMNTNTPVPFKVPEWTLLNTVFRIDSVDRKAQSMMCGAYTVKPDYPELRVDSLKFMDKNYKGNIYMIDVLKPSPDATTIYRFNSKFDSTNILGKMKHKPVGVEYMGNDYKSIMLSFPLYYMDTTDARQFLHYVMKEKFVRPVGLAETHAIPSSGMMIYPNPARNGCNISFSVDCGGPAAITIQSLTGNIVKTIPLGNLKAGLHDHFIETGSLASGIYIISVKDISGKQSSKMVKMD